MTTSNRSVTTLMVCGGPIVIGARGDARGDFPLHVRFLIIGNPTVYLYVVVRTTHIRGDSDTTGALR